MLLDNPIFWWPGRSVAADKDTVDLASTVLKSISAWSQIAVVVTFRYVVHKPQMDFGQQPNLIHQMSDSIQCESNQGYFDSTHSLIGRLVYV